MRVFGDLQSAQLENLAAAPGNAPIGRVYFDTVLNVPSVYNGVAWVSMTTSAPTTAGAVYSTGAAFASVAFAAHGNMAFGVNAAGNAAEFKNFGVGTAGTDFAVAHSVGGVTFNLPSASAANRGAVTTGSQTFAGAKTFNGAILGSDGTVVAPSYAFNNEPGTGLYLVGAGDLGVAVAGVSRWQFIGNILSASAQTQTIQNSFGAVGAPGYSFATDSATGMYRSGASQLAFSVGGTQALLMGSFGLNVFNGGNFKVAIFTGTLAPQGGAATLTAPSGTILSVSGMGQHDFTTSYRPIATAGVPGDIYFTAGTSTTVNVVNQDANGGNGNSAYRVVMFYA